MVTVSEAEKHFYDDNGYLGPFRAWTETEISEYRELLDREVFRQPGSDQASRAAFKDRHLESKSILELASHPAIIDRIAELIGNDLVLWTT